MTTTNDSKGQMLLNSVERVLASNETILAIVEEERRRGPGASKRIVSRFSTRSAIAGAAAAAPSLVPGWGIVGAIGTTVAGMTYVLKTEVEMCLALCSLFGMDIARPEHRQMAFLLAAVGTHHVHTGRNVIVDAGAVSLEALAAYTPRELSKLVMRVFGILAVSYAAQSVGKVLLNAIPVVSVGIGFGVNMLRTERVGCAAIGALRHRAALHGRGRDSTAPAG